MDEYPCLVLSHSKSRDLYEIGLDILELELTTSLSIHGMRWDVYARDVTIHVCHDSWPV